MADIVFRSYFWGKVACSEWAINSSVLLSKNLLDLWKF